MIKTSVNQYKNIKDRVFLGSLPLGYPPTLPYGVLSGDKSKSWDNVLAAAVLQHIPDSNLFDFLLSIFNRLKVGGNLLLSVPTKYPFVVDNRDKSGRLFYIRSKDEYLLLLERIGFVLIHEMVADDVLGRDDTVWTTLVLNKKFEVI